MDLSRLYFRLPFVICVNGYSKAQIEALILKLRHYLGAEFRFSEEAFYDTLDDLQGQASAPFSFATGPYIGVNEKQPGAQRFLMITESIHGGHTCFAEDQIDALFGEGKKRIQNTWQANPGPTPYLILRQRGELHSFSQSLHRIHADSLEDADRRLNVMGVTTAITAEA
jgi:hypothetical protein